jgi:hypothetical protein
MNIDPPDILRSLNEYLRSLGCSSSGLRTITVRIGPSAFPLIVGSNEYIETIKQDIKTSANLPTNIPILLFDEIAEHEILDRTTIDLRFRPSFCVTVLTPIFLRKSGQTPFRITVSPNAKVSDIKQKISGTPTFGISSPQLLFQGKEVQDEEDINPCWTEESSRLYGRDSSPTQVIFVKHESLSHLGVIEVPRNALISSVIEKAAEEGFPMNGRWLEFEGRKLENSETLPNFSGTETPTLFIKGASTNISVKTLKGERIPFMVDLRDSVGVVMEIIRDSQGLPYESQRIIFGGRQLEREGILGDYGVKDNSLLCLALNLRG